MSDLRIVVELMHKSGFLDGVANFDPDKTFRENGIDSLDTMSLLLAVEEGLGVKFRPAEVATIDSAAAVVAALDARERSTNLTQRFEANGQHADLRHTAVPAPTRGVCSVS